MDEREKELLRHDKASAAEPPADALPAEGAVPEKDERQRGRAARERDPTLPTGDAG